MIVARFQYIHPIGWLCNQFRLCIIVKEPVFLYSFRILSLSPTARWQKRASHRCKSAKVSGRWRIGENRRYQKGDEDEKQIRFSDAARQEGNLPSFQQRFQIEKKWEKPCTGLGSPKLIFNIYTIAHGGNIQKMMLWNLEEQSWRKRPASDSARIVREPDGAMNERDCIGRTSEKAKIRLRLKMAGFSKKPQIMPASQPSRKGGKTFQLTNFMDKTAWTFFSQIKNWRHILPFGSGNRQQTRRVMDF